MKLTKLAILTLLISLFCHSHLKAQDTIKSQNTVLLIDGSSYSGHSWNGKSKIKVLREALSHTLVEVNKKPSWGYMVGARIFGDKSERSINDCFDTRVAAKLDWFEPALINIIVEGIKPKGRSCFTNAIAETKLEFNEAKPGSENYLVCIVSAADECAKQEDITIDYIVKAANLKAVYVIGLNVKDSYKTMFDEIFKTQPGKFINVKNPGHLSATLTTVMNEYCRGIEEKPADKEPDGKSSKKAATQPAKGKK